MLSRSGDQRQACEILGISQAHFVKAAHEGLAATPFERLQLRTMRMISANIVSA